jgi:hypothetical protein
MADLFFLLLASVAFFSFLGASLLGLASVLWLGKTIPQPVSVSLSLFSISLLGLAFKDNGPLILIMLTITSVCWILVSVHQSLKGDKGEIK